MYVNSSAHNVRQMLKSQIEAYWKFESTEIKTSISNLVHTTHFPNNNQVHIMSKDFGIK
jgi:hypothetical protein